MKAKIRPLTPPPAPTRPLPGLYKSLVSEQILLFVTNTKGIELVNTMGKNPENESLQTDWIPCTRNDIWQVYSGEVTISNL